MVGVDCLDGSKFKSLASLWTGVESYASSKNRVFDREIGLSMSLLSIPRSCSIFGREADNLLVSSFKNTKAVVKEE